jgi:WD40 repeat protein
MITTLQKLACAFCTIETLLLTVVVGGISCSATREGGSTPPGITGQIQNRIELGSIDLDGPDSVHLAFSASGQMLCAWWSPGLALINGRYVKQPDEFRIFDLAGKLLWSSTNSDRSLLWSNFPALACAQAHKAFQTNAEGWFLAPDCSWGIRVFKKSSLGDDTVECWSLPQEPNVSPLWTRNIARAFGVRPIATIGSSDSEVLCSKGAGQEGLVLSRRTGDTIRTFTLGHIETDQEATKRNRRFGLGYDWGDPALYFSSHHFSYEETNHLLACGASHDKRVRVLDITPPVKVVFEANTDVNPARPRGGLWKVSRVEFASDCKYLIAGYDFGGRMTKVSIDSTEIFDTRNWKCIWSEEDSKIGSVTLSPDGRLLAYVRDDGIEIVPFQLKQ